MPYEKRYTAADNSTFEMWQIRPDGSSRQVWNWEFREDYDPNTVIVIPYAPPPPPNPPSLDFLKAQKIAALKAEHDDILALGCDVSFQNVSGETINTKFDCEDKNREDWVQGLVFIEKSIELGQFPADGTTTVRDFHNMNHAVSIPTYKAIVLQIGGYCYQHRETYWGYIEAANAAQSADELNAIR